MSEFNDLSDINRQLADQNPEDIMRWAVDLDKDIIVTTNFGPYEAVILHMAVQVKPDIPVVWIDSGYNTAETYLKAERVIRDLNLNLHVFQPAMTAARRDALFGGIPAVDTEEHEEFTRQVKLEPFQRAMTTMQPEVWLTAVRRDQTAFREGMDIVSDGPFNVLKVAPLLNWTQAEMEQYRQQHALPQVDDYFDPTKVHGNRECGLHTMAS